MTRTPGLAAQETTEIWSDTIMLFCMNQYLELHKKSNESSGYVGERDEKLVLEVSLGGYLCGIGLLDMHIFRY